jgi:hypothetical protein
MLVVMVAEADEEISGLELLRQPATLALADHLSDLHATLGFRAFLALMVVKVDYGHGDPSKFPNQGDPPAPDSAYAQMTEHSGVLEGMLFCRGVNSFLTYLADLVTLIYEKYPKKLPSNKQVTYAFCIEHHTANDLISALAEETVRELTHQNLGVLGKYFRKNLDIPLFTKETHAETAALCVDIRNIITHNRGIVNRFFIQRNPRFASDIGKRVVLEENEMREMLGTLGYCARQLDIRAIKKFGLETIAPQFEDDNKVPANEGA